MNIKDANVILGLGGEENTRRKRLLNNLESVYNSNTFNEQYVADVIIEEKSQL